ncbi:tyrosine-type recombinase/integrase [Streptomyces sp. NBC_00847]|uniref:tyrosine-type recombinase/integrase n=1 Tax=unclassified Streptomyces TaxID=2593676 RepID=UPI00225121F4|nr:tyrosine-type recombinase/integrase [Streptomyces sp. NBC_00847]MCX4882595.1 site-specific integrase [Streptomyces sp. NBC_00847]
MSSPLRALPARGLGQTGRDRLELLETLINGPSFDPLFRGDVLNIPRDHEKYGWGCAVPECLRTRNSSDDFCHTHQKEWNGHLARDPQGATRVGFLAVAAPLEPKEGYEPELCAVCPDRPVHIRSRRICMMHYRQWDNYARRAGASADFSYWLRDQVPYPHGYGPCRAATCERLADTPLRLCAQHRERYIAAGRPGRVTLPRLWERHYERTGEAVPVSTEDPSAFEAWCAKQQPVYQLGQINLLGMRPLAKAELQWGLEAHTRDGSRTLWTIADLRMLTNECREYDVDSLAGLDLDRRRMRPRQIAREILSRLRPLYYTKEDSREAGFIETEHFGRRLPGTDTCFDLSTVPQQWLRGVLWDHIARLLQSVDCPRSRGPLDSARRALSELGAFLEADAPGGGHDPKLLTGRHAEDFAADQRHRAAGGLPSLVLRRTDGSPGTVTTASTRTTFSYVRKLLYELLESGQADVLGLDRAFITALPRGGRAQGRKRRPFDDRLARALADDGNLSRFATNWDPNDRGLRDAWEALVYTGRRCSEVLELRFNCISYLNGIPMLWHDQTKVGNLDAGIRIPEYLFNRLDNRRKTTLQRFERRQGRMPTALEQEQLALFPTHVKNPKETEAISHGFFSSSFREWVATFDLGRGVPHQARHTLATKLLRAGASLTHIKKYLGQVSEHMAEHYVDIAGSDLDDLLPRVWVGGPGSDNPGEPLFDTATNPLSRETALALAVDVGRRCTPTLGGLCTAQVVVDGGKCPRNLDCDSCDKLVMTGADLLYWRRKREQWYSIAERAPDDATADYLHKVFEPTARAIDGLEKALAGLGLLGQALALDLRRPQDYFSHMWNTGFPVEEIGDIDTYDDQEGEVA